MRRFCTILLATLAFTFSANASVTLQECRDKARKNYPLVRRYDLIRATKECNVHNASLSWLPRLEFGGGGAWLSNVTDAADLGEILGQLASMIDLSGKKEQPWQYKVSASVTQNIWDGDASALGKKTAEAVAAKDEAELEARLIDGSSLISPLISSLLFTLLFVWFGNEDFRSNDTVVAVRSLSISIFLPVTDLRLRSVFRPNPTIFIHLRNLSLNI